MRKVIIIVAVAAVAGLTGAAIAHEEAQTKRDAPRVQGISPEEMKAKVDKLGYDLRRLEQEQGRYEVHAIDRQSGGAVEAKFDAQNGDLIRAKLDR
jgi:hypothetical protein